MNAKIVRSLLALCFLLPAITKAQVFPSPTFTSVTLQSPLTVTNGGTGVTSSTGSGSVVLSTSPALVTPALGVPTSGTLTNATGLPLATGVTGTLPVANGGTGVTSSTGSGSVVLSTSPALTTPNLGTPSAVTLTNVTGLPIAGISGLGTTVPAALGWPVNGIVTSSAGLVGSVNPSIVTPTITTPTIVGVTNASNAGAGNVGEYISSSGSSVSLTTTTATNVTSISLTAGDWDLSGGFTVLGNTTNLSNAVCGYSTTSAAFGSTGSFAQIGTGGAAVFLTYSNAVPIGRLNISSTTTVYLVCEAIFASGTTSASGIIQARRMR